MMSKRITRNAKENLYLELRVYFLRFVKFHNGHTVTAIFPKVNIVKAKQFRDTGKS